LINDPLKTIKNNSKLLKTDGKQLKIREKPLKTMKNHEFKLAKAEPGWGWDWRVREK
jgi:hypothetical protein